MTHWTKLNIILLVLLFGCGSLPCQKPTSITGPVRLLRVALVLDKSNIVSGTEFIDSCGQKWFEQTGIKINVVKTIIIPEWKESGIDEALVELSQVMAGSGYPGSYYDIAIGVGASPVTKLKIYLGYIIPFPSWRGATDNTTRSLIRVAGHGCWYLQHEMAHCFIFSHIHSDSGMLAAGTVGILPGVELCNPCLNKVDLEELIKNKFRDFHVEELNRSIEKIK